MSIDSSRVVHDVVHMEAVWYQPCHCVCVRGDAVESVNQSSAPHREAEAAADLQVFSGC